MTLFTPAAFVASAYFAAAASILLGPVVGFGVIARGKHAEHGARLVGYGIALAALFVVLAIFNTDHH